MIFFLFLLLPCFSCFSLQMRSSNYIKFVTRCYWASPGYCINIDAMPEISQYIYSLTTLDCLLEWNMGAGLFSREAELNAEVTFPKETWQKSSSESVFSPCIFVMETRRESDWRWYSSELSPCESFNLIFTENSRKSWSDCSTKCPIPVILAFVNYIETSTPCSLRIDLVKWLTAHSGRCDETSCLWLT